MKRCPTCGSAWGDDETVCVTDGTRLTYAFPIELIDEDTLNTPAVAPKEGPAGSCAACGTLNADDGDGYCKICGHRLASTPPPEGEEPAASLRSGASIGGYSIVGPAARDDARAIKDDGTEAFLVLGSPTAVGAETDALRALAGDRSFPRVIEAGTQGPFAFLALTLPSGSMRKLADVAHTESPAGALRILGALLDAMEKVEEAGYSFAPLPRDLLLAPDGAVVLMRIRGAERGTTMDARAVFESLGDIFLSAALLGPTSLVRLLTPSLASSMSEARSIADLRADLAAVQAELPRATGCGKLAELCDQGLWRPYNQDATAISQGKTVHGDPYAILVVCDGVSSSSYSDRASRTAAAAARDALDHFARSPDIAHQSAESAVSESIRAAHLAICSAHAADPVSDLPGTTIVAALVHKKRVTLGWIGDSRAYLITERGAELLTHDHSWVNEAIARGEVKHPSEVQGSLAHTITRCLGPLEVGEIPSEIDPDVKSRDLGAPGLLLLCSDGLWNYAPDAEDIARVLLAAPDERNAFGVARLLVNYALARGGQDNVSVAIFVYP
ncbi:MAG: PP2C family protein-serine/threonine phosphatase [Byssovorax sp.]